MVDVKEFTENEFTEAVKKGEWIVDFWAPWCGPCLMMAPHFTNAASKKDNVNFAKVNIEEYTALGPKFDIRGIPCLIFFKDGKEVHRTVGLLNSAQILDNVKEAFD